LDVQFHSYMPPEAPFESPTATQFAENPETQIILDALLAKEPSEKIIEIIQSEQVFIYCILNKCKKSLEHLKQSIEKYRKVFTTLYSSAKAQRQIIELIVGVFGPSKNDEMRDKASKVIQKLCQIKVLTNQAVIEWAASSIQAKGAANREDVSQELELVLQAL